MGYDLCVNVIIKEKICVGKRDKRQTIKVKNKTKIITFAFECVVDIVSACLVLKHETEILIAFGMFNTSS